MVTISPKLFERRGDRWDTLGLGQKDPIADALKDIADKRLSHVRGYDAGPVRKPRYDGAAMHPQPRSLLGVKPLKLIEKEAMAGLRARRYAAGVDEVGRKGYDLVTRLVPKEEVDLVQLSQDELAARVDAGRDWVAAERARIAAERAKISR